MKAAEATLTAAGDTSPMTPGANGHRRPPDLRIAVLAQHLANTQDADEVTGEQVGQLLSMDISPRTGRRLLGAARELLDQHPPARPARTPAQRQRRTPNRDDKKYDKNRPELGWAGLGLAHTRRPGPQDVDNDIAPATISAGQPSGTF